MQTLLANINMSPVSTIRSEEIASFDCEEILQAYGLPYKQAGSYLQVGEINGIQGWVLHVSIVRSQFSALIETVVPFLISMKVPFQIPRDRETVKWILEGFHGLHQIGKIVCIYIEQQEKTLLVAKQLVELTQGFRGPAVPTDSLLGGTVYTRYEAFNPIIKTSRKGDPKAYIYDSAGKLFPHKFSIPFIIPAGVLWPFATISEPVSPVRKKLWNQRYRPLSILKADCKGRVIQGNYFKGIFNIEPCIVKEGVKDMWVDDFGRAITDRLNWQYELSKDLAGHVPIPEIFDYFEEQNCTYLAMKFVKGESLNEHVLSIFDGKCWFDLPISQQFHLIDLFLQLIGIIANLHKRGYIHRDITPTNFIITKKSEIFLIDMELAYSIDLKKPNPPFKQGTPGFMSPEQIETQVPTTKEDIYALGALMIFVFTGLLPIKFNPADDDFLEQLIFFTKHLDLAKLIQSCLSSIPQIRPSLATIENTIRKYRHESTILSSPKKSKTEVREIHHRKITDLINKAINFLRKKEVTSLDCIWLSSVEIIDQQGMVPTERVAQSGFYKGITGILYLLGRAKGVGYNLDGVVKEYEANFSYLEKKYLASQNLKSPGIYDGAAGMALAIKEGIRSGLLIDTKYGPYLERCFQSIASRLDLATGVTGQALALINCIPYLAPAFYKPLLQQYIGILIEAQQSDGSWPNYRNSQKRKDNSIGLAFGTAGVVCLLIEYVNYSKDSALIPRIQRGLDWLYKSSKIKNGSYYWTTSTKSISENNFSSDLGLVGIALTFIKAYALLKEQHYKMVAENALRSLPDNTTHFDYRQSYGLSGLGEVYIEASRVLGREPWQHRLDHLANIFIHTFMKDTRYGHWSVTAFPNFEPDLMTGTCGIIHFLMRYQMPEKIGHVLFDN